MKALGVVANVQPQMVASDGCWVEEKVDEKLIGEKAFERRAVDGQKISRKL